MATNKRNTVQRALVLDAVQSLHTHPTSADVYEVVHAANPSVSRATVYRNLAVLAAEGQILHVQVPHGADHYDFRTDAHYHAVCRECGAVYDVDVALPAESELAARVSDAHGFSVEGCSLVFTGLCEHCAAKAQQQAS